MNALLQLMRGRRSNTLRLVVTVTICISTASLFAADLTNLVVNGSFEEGDNPRSSEELKAASLGLSGWSIRKGNIDYIGNRWAAADGRRSIDLNGSAIGTISQSITNLLPGQRYRLSFQMAVNPEAPPIKTALIATIAGVSNRYSMVTAGTHGKPGWRIQYLEFDAREPHAELSLSSLNRGWAGALLDDFKLIAIEVPPRLPPSHAARAYDLAADFSAISNPNGPWRYGWKAARDGPLTLLTFTKTNGNAGEPQSTAWQLNSVDGPSVGESGPIRGESSKTAGSPASSSELPWLSIAPGTTDAPEVYGAARFTVPVGQAGTYRIHTQTQNPNAGDSDFHIVRGEIELFGLFVAAGIGAHYASELILKEGETVDFVVGRGWDGRHAASHVRVNAHIQRAD